MASDTVPQTSNRFWSFFDDQVRLLKKKVAAVDIFDETMADKAADNPWYALGSMIYLFWITTIVTGLVLIMWYIPNTARAYASIEHIQDVIPLGWMVRGMHKYAADAIIIAATMRTYRLYFTGEYKTKEIAWVISIVTLLLGMFSGLTGYLLMWNQRAFWASKVFATFPTYIDQIPVFGKLHIGMTTAQFMLGGAAIGEATMTRFYAGHFALSMVALIAVEAYFVRKGFRRINLSWPSIGLLLSMLVLAAMFIRLELGSPANRAETPLPILSDWYFLGLYQMMKEMKPLWAVLGTMVIPALALAMPLLDTAKDVPTWRRPFFLMVGVAAFIHWLLLSYMILADKAQITTDPPKVWASWILLMLCGGCFEYKAMGYPQKKVQRKVIELLVLWAVLFAVYAGWTRFRQPQYSMSYLPPGMYEVIAEEDAKVRDEMNGRFSGTDPDSIWDDARNAVQHPLVTQWYMPATADDAPRTDLIAQIDNVRSWWIMMSLILLICAGGAVMTTPPEGIESKIYPSRTPRGKLIKGLADDPDAKKKAA